MTILGPDGKYSLNSGTLDRGVLLDVGHGMGRFG